MVVTVLKGREQPTLGPRIIISEGPWRASVFNHHQCLHESWAPPSQSIYVDTLRSNVPQIKYIPAMLPPNIVRHIPTLLPGKRGGGIVSFSLNKREMNRAGEGTYQSLWSCYRDGPSQKPLSPWKPQKAIGTKKIWNQSTERICCILNKTEFQGWLSKMPGDLPSLGAKPWVTQYQQKYLGLGDGSLPRHLNFFSFIVCWKDLRRTVGVWKPETQAGDKKRQRKGCGMSLKLHWCPVLVSAVTRTVLF